MKLHKNETRLENVSRWHGHLMRSGDRYLLHGIDVIVHFCEEHKCDEEDLVIPRIGPLIETVKANPKSHEFQWLAEDKKWVAIMPNLNG